MTELKLTPTEAAINLIALHLYYENVKNLNHPTIKEDDKENLMRVIKSSQEKLMKTIKDDKLNEILQNL